MDVVERLRVDPLQVLDPARDVRFGRLDDEMEVIRHQAVEVELPPAAPHDLPQEAGEQLAIEVVEEDRRSVDAARGDVVDAAGDLWARRARHASTVRRGTTDTGARAGVGTESAAIREGLTPAVARSDTAGV
jgi:hypothetical protein